jgi:toxin FitB
MFLLDSNLVSEMRKPKPHGAVKTWVASLADKDMYIASLTLGEIQAGIEKTRETDAGKAADLTLWADALAASPNVIDADATIFRLHAHLMHRKSHAEWEDALIAATALVHNLTIATRNTKDFARFDVPLINPFQFNG